MSATDWFERQYPGMTRRPAPPGERRTVSPDGYSIGDEIMRNGRRGIVIGTHEGRPTQIRWPNTGNNTVGAILDAMGSAQSEAREANEARYEEILSGYDELAGQLTNLGNQAAADIQQGAQNQAAAGTQQLVNAGLSGTTAALAPHARAAQTRAANMGRLNAQLRREQVGLGESRLQFMERRTDAYPDTGVYMDLLRQYGHAQGLRSGMGDVVRRALDALRR